MCKDVGVVKKIELEKVSKRIAALVTELDVEVSVNVKEIKEIEESLKKMIAPKY